MREIVRERRDVRIRDLVYRRVHARVAAGTPVATIPFESSHEKMLALPGDARDVST